MHQQPAQDMAMALIKEGVGNAQHITNFALTAISWVILQDLLFDMWNTSRDDHRHNYKYTNFSQIILMLHIYVEEEHLYSDLRQCQDIFLSCPIPGKIKNKMWLYFGKLSIYSHFIFRAILHTSLVTQYWDILYTYSIVIFVAIIS